MLSLVWRQLRRLAFQLWKNIEWHWLVMTGHLLNALPNLGVTLKAEPVWQWAVLLCLLGKLNLGSEGLVGRLFITKWGSLGCSLKFYSADPSSLSVSIHLFLPFLLPANTWTSSVRPLTISLFTPTKEKAPANGTSAAIRPPRRPVRCPVSHRNWVHLSPLKLTIHLWPQWTGSYSRQPPFGLEYCNKNLLMLRDSLQSPHGKEHKENRSFLRSFT